MKKPPLVEPSLGPDEKLTAYMKLHRELKYEMEILNKKLNPIIAEKARVKSNLDRIGTAINHLKHGRITPLVTDHAIVRYLERVENLDIDEIRLKIAKHSKAVKQGNVIVTVNGDLEEENE